MHLEKSSITTFKTACKEAMWTFVLSRVVIIILTYLGISFFPQNRSTHSLNCFTDTRACLVSWMHYDVFSYI